GVGGGTATTLSSGPNSNVAWRALQLDVSFAYCLDVTAKVVNKVSKTGGNPSPLGSGLTAPLSFVMDATHFYVMDGSVAPFSIQKLANTGGSAVPLVSSVPASANLAIDGTNLYFATTGANGAIMKVPVGGGMPAVLADGQTNISGIAVDGTSVYWITYADPGVVMKVTPK